MKNRDVYLKDPSTWKLVNEGVASVNDEKTSQALTVLRYELETFVCDGQYEKGLAHILETFLKNINQAQQPGVWISGFYGSGKSHLAKMLRALWVDTAFDDGASARGIAQLPHNILDSLKELSVQSKRYGGLHSASGTLGAGASGSVRLALLRIVFKSVGLPEQYPIAKFCLWLKEKGIYDQVRMHVERNNDGFEEELDNFYVTNSFAKALTDICPELFSSSDSCKNCLQSQFPPLGQKDISNDDMTKTIKQTLTVEDKFPLSLIVLDEVQQYIGEDSQRSNNVQEVVETCCKHFGGKLLFIGTGQTAVTGTSNLKKLEGRFTVRIELSDADVDTVIRKVILAKKPQAIKPLDDIMQQNIGEISRHLEGTNIGYKTSDIEYFPQDYPILPVRRRFWENTLRILDQTGTESQLRNQLSMVHKVIQLDLDKSIGTIVPTDYLYFESAQKLLQSRALPRKIYEKTMTWIKGSENEQLIARACGLIFLISKLIKHNKETGIKATSETLSDLMLKDISNRSSSLRNQLPALLDKCDLLMKIGDEYRIQTDESTAWNDDFLRYRSYLLNESTTIEVERNDRIRKKLGEIIGKINLSHGKSKITRSINPVLADSLPDDNKQKVCLWVRNGWSIDENSVRVDALQAGTQSPVVFIFLPKRSADDLRHNIMEFLASKHTLDNRGNPSNPEGIEAQSAMETTKNNADRKINELLEDVFSGARVFQGGGNEVLDNDLQQILRKACENAISRLYPEFDKADHPAWAKVYEKAQQGSPDALKAIDFEGDPASNTVCKTILAFIQNGKKGSDIRDQFESAPYGWPRDSIDGALQVLLVAGHVLALDERKQTIEPKKMERKAIGKTWFKQEFTTISASEKLNIRKLMLKLGITVKPGDELNSVSSFLVKLRQLAHQAGGDAPKPETPDTNFIDEIEGESGNNQLKAIASSYDCICQKIELWNRLKISIEDRWQKWELLKQLSQYAYALHKAEEVLDQIRSVEETRQLISEPDFISPLLSKLSQLFRSDLDQLDLYIKNQYEQHLAVLESNPNWNKLNKKEKDQILNEFQLSDHSLPKINLSTSEEILDTLKKHSLSNLNDRLDALKTRFDGLSKKITEKFEPKTQFLSLPSVTLKTQEEIDQWIDETKKKLTEELKKGPITIK